MVKRKKKITKKSKQRKNQDSKLITNIINLVDNYDKNIKLLSQINVKISFQQHENYINNLQYLLENSIVEFIGFGNFGSVYKLYIDKNLITSNKIIRKGTYALKVNKLSINNASAISNNCFDNLLKYSKYGIIPEIYLHNRYYTLMEYIDGITLRQVNKLYDNKEISAEIYENILIKYDNLIKIFKKLFPYDAPVDLNPGNTLISKDLRKVYLIDACY